MDELQPLSSRTTGQPWNETVLASGLRSPDGLAVDGKTGLMYVSEEDANNVLRIWPDGQKELLLTEATPVFESVAGQWVRTAGLRAPEGLELDERGHLYVVEDRPGGRLLEFYCGDPTMGRRPVGRVVPVPQLEGGFAWESVDVGPTGELLLAGSTVDACLSGTVAVSLPIGAVLYRDATGAWWMPLRRALSSYSSAAFSADGSYAAFACELSGQVGLLDLSSHQVGLYTAAQEFRSPECVVLLGDGGLLVEEESGKVFLVDHATESTRMLFDVGSSIESICWDERQGRMLVTEDGSGTLRAFEGDLVLGDPEKMISRPPFEPEPAADLIPEQCPDYLAEVLRQGGYDPGSEESGLSFPELARRLSIFAIDAKASLKGSDEAVEDPIQSIQFAVFSPRLFGVDLGEWLGPVSGFVASHHSGVRTQTQTFRRAVHHRDLLTGKVLPLGAQPIALPQPIGAHVTQDGMAAIHFMGQGELPDFHLAFSTRDPGRSFMFVAQPHGGWQLYQLDLPSSATSNPWVVALGSEEPERWQSFASPGVSVVN